MTTVDLAKAAEAKLQSLMPLLDQAGFMKDIYDDFYEPLAALITACASSTGLSSEKLLQDLNEPGQFTPSPTERNETD